LQDLELVLDESLDRRIGEIDLVDLLAIGAALQLPHDHQALALVGGLFQVVVEIEETLQEPRLGIETVIVQLER
jgi:hypothetical protein